MMRVSQAKKGFKTVKYLHVFSASKGLCKFTTTITQAF
jgi:hypothetical protein